MLLLFGGRPNRLEIILDERPIFPWNAVLIQQIFLRGAQLGFHVSVIESRALLLAHLFDVLFLSLILHSFNFLLLEFYIESRRRSLDLKFAVACARRHQAVAFAVARHRRSGL